MRAVHVGPAHRDPMGAGVAHELMP
jgi:hypothetical protein